MKYTKQAIKFFDDFLNFYGFFEFFEHTQKQNTKRKSTKTRAKQKLEKETCQKPKAIDTMQIMHVVMHE